ncbi:hypothetical protein [Actinoplanes sp. N902-109]|uniref:hypothetical protein n=1 Tax=Actinoplanes sp. (strain N902-109) TaxID=649831 RepID=UPI0012FB5954|nr:hypothetical protein [Actinoplanes sp. N902-109]
MSRFVDRVPRSIQDTTEAQLVEARARTAEAAALVDAALASHGRDRTHAAMVDVLLDIRSALNPAAADSQLVRATAPVAITTTHRTEGPNP